MSYDTEDCEVECPRCGSTVHVRVSVDVHVEAELDARKHARAEKAPVTPTSEALGWAVKILEGLDARNDTPEARAIRAAAHMLVVALDGKRPHADLLETARNASREIAVVAA